jgi:hypothetical protein
MDLPWSVQEVAPVPDAGLGRVAMRLAIINPANARAGTRFVFIVFLTGEFESPVQAT